MNAGLGVDYDDGYMKRRWFVTWYKAETTVWFRVFGFGLYYSQLIGFVALWPRRFALKPEQDTPIKPLQELWL